MAPLKKPLFVPPSPATLDLFSHESRRVFFKPSTQTTRQSGLVRLKLSDSTHTHPSRDNCPRLCMTTTRLWYVPSGKPTPRVAVTALMSRWLRLRVRAAALVQKEVPRLQFRAPWTWTNLSILLNSAGQSYCSIRQNIHPAFKKANLLRRLHPQTVVLRWFFDIDCLP
jgi:hypothetical protein